MSWAWVRTATVIVVAVVLVPLLTLHAYLLFWFYPYLTYHLRPALWLVIFALTAAGAGCLVFGWFCRHRSAWWWVWLPSAALCVAVTGPFVDRL